MQIPHYFENEGEHNLDKTLELVSKVADNNIKIIVATTKGTTALRAIEIFDPRQLIIVRHQAGFYEPFTQEMPEEVEEKIISSGAKLITAGHAFAGLDRGVRRKLNTWQHSEHVAMVYRTFGQGTKVCVEIVLMAADAGLIKYEEVIAIGGTGRGADTAWSILPAHTSNYMDLRLNKLICKPIWMTK